jgi:lipoate---protein ligase
MFCISLDTNDPCFNLAVEEVLLTNSKEEYVILGINMPSVIIGKHQSAHKEVNTKFIRENNIPLIRRISGGGTVFHDMGNLNFTFIRQSEEGKQVDFRKYTRPVIDFLLSLGIEAKFEDKNDLRVHGFKISGNAEHIHRNRVLHHGTILFSTSLDILRKVLRKDTSCYISRAVESNPSSVMNLNEKVIGFQDIFAFRSEMMHYFLNNLPEMIIHEISQTDKEKAELLAASKYKTWEWNYAYGPEYTFKNSFKFAGKQVSCRLFVEDGIIKECDISGSEELKAVSKKIPGCRHMVTDLLENFKAENILFADEEIYNFF